MDSHVRAALTMALPFVLGGCFIGFAACKAAHSAPMGALLPAVGAILTAVGVRNMLDLVPQDGRKNPTSAGDNTAS